MTKPGFQWQISLGNVIQIALLLLGVGISWATFDARITNNTDAIKAARDASEAAIKAARVETERITSDHEARLRVVETGLTRTDERLTSILSILSRIDARLEAFDQRGPWWGQQQGVSP